MSEKNFAILRTEKLNRLHMPQIKKRSDHVNQNGIVDNVNPKLTYLNRCVVGETGSDWYKLFKARYKELAHYKDPNSRKLNSNAVISIEAVETMSHGMADKIDIDAWIKTNNKWMVDAGLQFNAREIMGDRNMYTERQRQYAMAMNQFGLQRGLQRGSRAK